MNEMANVGLNQIKIGNGINWQNEIFIVVGMEHVKPGKGPAYVQMKMKNAVSGRVIDHRFRSADTVDQADMNRLDAQFSYASGDRLVFMDNDTYDEIEMTEETVGTAKNYLVEGNSIILCMVGSQVLSLELPKSVVLEVVETEPGIKNASATNVGKPATMNTGAVVTVPPFINVGDRIKVDTENNSYVERVNK
jgi:elongation factor P